MMLQLLIALHELLCNSHSFEKRCWSCCGVVLTELMLGMASETFLVPVSWLHPGKSCMISCTCATSSALASCHLQHMHLSIMKPGYSWQASEYSKGEAYSTYSWVIYVNNCFPAGVCHINLYISIGLHDILRAKTKKAKTPCFYHFVKSEDVKCTYSHSNNVLISQLLNIQAHLFHMCMKHSVHPWSQCILLCVYCTVQMSKDQYPESSPSPWILKAMERENSEWESSQGVWINKTEGTQCYTSLWLYGCTFIQQINKVLILPFIITCYPLC